MDVPRVTNRNFALNTMRSLRHLFSRLFKAATFTLTRGHSLFFAEGGIYIEDRSATRVISERLASPNSGLADGAAYARLGTRRASSHELVVDVVLINSVGRLGNSIIQLGNALQTAKNLGATRIKYFRWDAIQNATIRFDGVVVSMLKTSKPTNGETTKLIWRTQAFKSGAINFELQEDGPPSWARGLSTALGRKNGTSESAHMQLTIHLRSGDVFEQAPHPAYGQPPSAFYRRVLEHQRWKLVNIATEDDKNPCLADIQEWCDENGVAVSVSGATLSHTLDVLGASSHIAIGTGTFVPAVQLLDNNPRTFYVFANDPHPLLLCKGNKIFRVEDLTRSYCTEVMQMNWANNERQRWLMKNYPVELLSPPKSLTT